MFRFSTIPWLRRKQKCFSCAGFGTRQVSCDHHATDGEDCNLDKFSIKCSSCDAKWKSEDERQSGNPFICRACNGFKFHRPICPSCNGNELKGVPCHRCDETGEQMGGNRSGSAYPCHHCGNSDKELIKCQYVTVDDESCYEGFYFGKCWSCNGIGKFNNENTICESCRVLG